MSDWTSLMKWVLHSPYKLVSRTSGTATKEVLRQFSFNPTFIRIAGVSGALAISMASYGAHSLILRVKDRKQISTFETANNFHMLHSVALLGVPFARIPALTAGLYIFGMILFCGNCYYYSLTGSEKVRKFVPIGGVLLITAWLSLII